MELSWIINDLWVHCPYFTNLCSPNFFITTVLLQIDRVCCKTIQGRNTAWFTKFIIFTATEEWGYRQTLRHKSFQSRLLLAHSSSPHKWNEGLEEVRCLHLFPASDFTTSLKIWKTKEQVKLKRLAFWGTRLWHLVHSEYLFPLRNAGFNIAKAACKFCWWKGGLYFFSSCSIFSCLHTLSWILRFGIAIFEYNIHFT